MGSLPSGEGIQDSMARSARGPYIALVTPYGFTRARRLADELDAMGYRTTLIDDPARADRALDADACVIVLTPDEWRDPAIVEVMRSRPPIIIPVLAAPMDPPRAPWSSEPIPMRGSPSAIAEAIADAVDDAIRMTGPGRAPSSSRPYGGDQRSASYGRGQANPSRPRGGYDDPRRGLADPSMGMGGGYGVPPQAKIAPAPKKSGGAGRVIGILLAVVVLAGGGFGAYHYRAKLFPPKVTTPAQMGPYSAAIPGPTCDKGNGKWQLEASSAFYTATCQSSALQVSQTSSIGTNSAAVYFTGTGPTFPTSYTVQMTATVTAGDQHTGVGFIVHGQSPSGGHVFTAFADTSWGFQVQGSDGQLAPPERRGFTPTATKTFQLEVEVDGPTMTFTLNGKQVTRLTETTYTTSAAVGLLLTTDNPTAKGPLTAQFANFKFTPLPDPTITSDQAVATAVAINATYPNPYTAAIPGPGCDKGLAQWAQPSVYDQTSANGTFACQSAALQLKANVGKAIDVGYYGIKGALKENYTITVTITPADVNSCGGVVTHASATGDYLYIICGDGSFAVLDINTTTNKSTTLDAGNSGTFASNNGAFTLTITENDPTHVLTVNGTARPAITNKDYTTTDHIALFAISLASTVSTATFSAFSFKQN